MDDQFQGLADVSADVPDLSPDMIPDVPMTLSTLTDGSDTVVIGDVTNLADFNHQQGENDLGFQEDCGLVSAQDVLNQFGIDASESDVVDFAAQNGLCEVTDDPSQSGGTTPETQAELLTDFGVPAHVEHGQSLEDLAQNVEQGRPVIIAGNAGVLWGDDQYRDQGQANHAVVVTGVSRDPSTGEIQGFYINDSGTGNSGQFVSADDMNSGWLATGGAEVVTDATPAAA